MTPEDGGWSEWAHLAKRFIVALTPLPLRPADRLWVESEILADGELRLWRRMSRADRRHAVSVARRVERALGSDATRPVLAAALLHDVGKVASGLGTWGRVPATLAGKAAGRDMAEAWSARRGFTRATGLYLRHDVLGADLLEVAGSDSLTITWAREHHWPSERWTVPRRIAEALKAADDD